APPSPDYVLGPEHDDDEIVAEDQPYAEDASPIALVRVETNKFNILIILFS
ncbi:hypothetical protein Tco_0685272, partial [Tanacetum coccineum]